MKPSGRARIIFVTGTDTGVGKTVLTSLLLYHLRQQGCHALATKPFCSGGTGDVDVLFRLQGGELTPREINPFFFSEPVAPLVAARRERRRVQLGEVIRGVRRLARRCECLLVEGAGGLLVPLGEGFCALDLIAGLRCDVIIAARNRLGVLNHTLLTVSALARAVAKPPTIVLMGTRRADASVATNARVLKELAGEGRVFSMGFLGARALSGVAIQRNERRCRRVLAGVLAAR